MSTAPARSRSHHRHVARRWPAIVVLLLLSVALVLTVAGCGSDEPATTTTAAPAGGGNEATTTSEAQAAMSPDDLGVEIGTVYVGALEQLVELLEDRPDVVSAKAQVEQLKEEHVSRLVELGHQREALDAADRAKVDSKIVSALDKAGREPWYADYNALWKEYSAQDMEFGTLIAGFNVLGQYANFDLLKQQLPAEAARLGID